MIGEHFARDPSIRGVLDIQNCLATHLGSEGSARTFPVEGKDPGRFVGEL